QRSLDLVDQVARITGKLPPGLGFLGDQIRRASAFVSLNFAEGCGRASTADRRRFFVMAQASARETMAIIDVLHRFRAVDETVRAEIADVADHLCAMLHRFG